MNFNRRQTDCGQSITNGIGVMAIGSGIDDNAVRPAIRLLNRIDQRSFAVGLDKPHIRLALLRELFQSGIDFVQTGGSVIARTS